VLSRLLFFLYCGMWFLSLSAISHDIHIVLILIFDSLCSFDYGMILHEYVSDVDVYMYQLGICCLITIITTLMPGVI